MDSAAFDVYVETQLAPALSPGTVVILCNCSIPDDHISPRRSALFIARSVLRELRDGAHHADPSSQASHDDAKVRAAIQVSDDAGTALAERFGVTAQTIDKWRNRDSVEDRSHTPHRLQTTLTPAQEAVAVALRKTLLISLDDLLALVRVRLKTNR